MPDSEPEPRLSVKLKATPAHTSSWVRVLQDGRIELEYYDFSPAADDNFGNDVAWMYHIAGSEKPRLCALLAEKTGTAISGDEAMLEAFAGGFRDTWQIKDWLKANGVPYEQEFDSWA
jgi:hypothetical protein